MRGGVQIPPSSFLSLKAILAYFKKPAARPVQPASPRAHRPGRGPSILAWPDPAHWPVNGPIGPARAGPRPPIYDPARPLETLTKDHLRDSMCQLTTYRRNMVFFISFPFLYRCSPRISFKNHEWHLWSCYIYSKWA